MQRATVPGHARPDMIAACDKGKLSTNRFSHPHPPRSRFEIRVFILVAQVAARIGRGCLEGVRGEHFVRMLEMHP